MSKKTQKFKIQKISDILAISLSSICAIHCLLTPIVLILFPIFSSSFVSDLLFHRLMLFLILPTSALAFFLGCKHHRDIYTAILGITGFLILLVSAIWGHDIFGLVGERLVTIVGGVIMSFAHFRNYKLCQEDTCHHHHH
ncbi:MAG: MerC family mercury resistance protein [Candidatus Dadabacteria bacterium]|nr:MerC family mercury resistance protein [Candidatus Dadabacteria bacterium]NIQ13775.1 MerC family mercury resistance protein [Candidatus Dadabacteria bacterium]